MQEAGLLTLLAVGLALQTRMAAWHAHRWASMTFVIGIAALAVVMGTSVRAATPIATVAAVLALPWVLGFGWLAWPTSEAPHSPAGWGRLWLAAAGMLLIGSVNDLVTLGLAVEVLRRATWLDDRSRAAPLDWLPVGLFWLGLAAWLSITGTLSLNELPGVLTTLGARGADPPLASLVGAALLLLGLLGGQWTALYAWLADEEARWPEHLTQLMARQIGQVVLFARLVPSLGAAAADEAAAILIVVSLAAAVVSVVCVGQRQRWDRWMLAVGWQQAFLQTALMIPLLLRHAPEVTLSAAPVTGLLFISTWHGLIAIAGLTAAAWGFGSAGRAPVFCDELLGAARQRPWLTAAAVVALGSLVGMPFLCGGWLRLPWLLSLWDTPMTKPGDILGPHQGSIVLAVVGAGTTVVLSITWGQLLRLALSEPPVRSHHQSLGWWPRAVALTASVILLAAGLWPDLWTQFLTMWTG